MNGINYNEVLISGIINVITDTNDKYVKFGLITNKYTLNGYKKVFVSLNIPRDLFNTYQEYFIKGNKVFINGYLNSYIDQNKKYKVLLVLLMYLIIQMKLSREEVHHI